MDSGTGTRALPRVAYPIRTSRDQRMVSSSPGLFAAAHVLLRLLAPRHPPCALILLIRKNTCVAAMEFSRCTRTRARQPRIPRPEARSLKTQQRVPIDELDIVLGEPTAPDEQAHPRGRRLPE